MTDELLSCPFCGGEASHAGHIRYDRPLKDAWWADGSQVKEAFYVNCIRCGAVSRSGIFTGYQTLAEAIAAWNRRAPVARQALPEPVGEVTGKLTGDDIEAIGQLWTDGSDAEIADFLNARLTPATDAPTLETLAAYESGRADALAAVREEHVSVALTTIATPPDSDGFTSDGHERAMEIGRRALGQAK